MFIPQKEYHWTENLEILFLTLLPAMFAAYSLAAVILFCLLLVNVIVKNTILKRWSFFCWHQDKNYQYDRFPLFFILMISYWLIYLISLIWTQNVSYGWREVSSQIWMLLFPLIFAITDFREINKGHIRGAMITMGAFLSTVFVFRFAEVSYNYIPDGDGFIWYMLCQANDFYPTHHSYMALYLLTALAFLYIVFFQIKKSKIPIITTTTLCLCVLCLCLFLMCINSRAGLLCLLILMMMCLAHLVIFKKKYVVGIISLALIVAMVVGVHFTLPEHFRNLSTTAMEMVSGDRSDGRIEIMKNSLAVIKENPIIGVGAGDRLDALAPFYENSENRITYNPHNQYLDTMMTTGIPGLIILLMLIFIPMIKAFKERKFGFFAFFILFGISILFESMLERQMGIFFFCLMLFLFTLDSQKKSVSLQIDS